ncbi:MAG: p-benzoquinone reductase, partial [Pseudomonadota bacterium]
EQAQGIIFGSPTYMGMASWQFKKVADATSKYWMSGAWKNKVAGGFTISSNLSGDKLSTLQYFMTLSMQLGMIWVGQAEGNDGHLNRLGSSSGAMAQVGPTSPAADIPDGDLDTARAYGKRVAEIVKRMHG